MGAVALATGVAEVDPAGELADDEQVGAPDALLAQWAGAEERLARLHRAQVRVQPEPLAQAQQTLLGARCARVGGVPLRPADRPQENGVRLAAGAEDLVGERGPVGVDRGAADEPLVELELAQRLEHDRGAEATISGADPVAGQQDDPGATTPPAFAPRC